MGAGCLSTRRNKRKSRRKVTASLAPITVFVIPPPLSLSQCPFGVVVSKLAV